MNYANLLTSQDGRIAIITINRPDKLNALNQATLSEIKQAVENAILDTNIRSILLTGSGDKAFVAGADIAEFSSFGVEEGRALSVNGHQIFNFIENSPKPILAAINGFALGGGCELAMACHLRVASNTARFGQPEANLGIIPGYAGTQRLVRLIGKTKAVELMMTCELIKADEALQLGLINYVVEPSQLLEKSIELLHKINSKAPQAIASIIRSTNAFDLYNVDGAAKETEEFAKCVGSQDFIEGTNAFLEKRKPVFTGNVSFIN